MSKPRVAIIGAGIFGVSCALELSNNFNVVVFEQEDDVMKKGTYANQYRHHYGFHYPRSSETVKQCLNAQDSFRSRWQDAIVEDIPSYYAVAKEGSKVSPDEFIKFCDDMTLQYNVEYPKDVMLNRDTVGICILTNEPVYDIYKLKKMAKEMLGSKSSVALNLSSKVVNARFEDGTEKKVLTISNLGVKREEVFDYVVNATYANQNLMKNWLGFPSIELEFRLKELPIIELSTDIKQAVTIMDGDFVTIVPFGHTGFYTLGDVSRSIIETKYSKEGVPWSSEYIASLSTRFEEMVEANSHYIPVLAKSKYIRSMFAVLPILKQSKETDARVTAITEHGRGCWSVFEGKIVTSVQAARDIANRIVNSNLS